MSKPQRIIEAARKRFRYYGIQKTTMQEIAQDAGIAVGTLYLYFSNKDELVVACAEEFVEHHRAEVEAILALRCPADEKLRKYVAARFRQARDIRSNSRHAVEIARAVLRVKPDRLEEEGLLMWDAISKILKLGVEQRVFTIANPADDAKIFLYSIAFFFPNALNEPRVPPTEEELLSVVNWFIGAWKGQRAAAKKRSREL
ncbi:MAG: TetR/AcrR family transcriptional regulator [Planctomycetia bacterium]|nr:TetR/AcrR family transcriptional regulator [Planctomycetia bacterium]